MPLSTAARIVLTDSWSSVPPHIHPPIAQVPRPMRETVCEVSPTFAALVSRLSVILSITSLPQVLEDERRAAGAEAVSLKRRVSRMRCAETAPPGLRAAAPIHAKLRIMRRQARRSADPYGTGWRDPEPLGASRHGWIVD